MLPHKNHHYVKAGITSGGGGINIFIVIILMTYALFDRLSKNSQILNLMKVPPVEGELCHADGQTR